MNNKSVSSNIIYIAARMLEQGSVIAYPTEGVYGLGCDPTNEVAVLRLLAIKRREMSKGLVIVAESWAQLARYILPVTADRLEAINATWPGPYTWVFPARGSAPEWIRGDHNSVAVRISDHPVVKGLCQEFKKAIVSTSANPEGEPPAMVYEEVCDRFKSQLDMIIEGEVGSLHKPTPILDAVTGKVLRD